MSISAHTGPRLALALLALPFAASLMAQGEVSFNRDIRPILSDACFQCHGPDANTRYADLRLDLRESAIERGAVEPGDPGASKLVERIRAEDPALRMPPAWANKTLTDEQRELLERWIAQGAEYQSHWAYQPPRRPEAPEGPAAISHLLAAKQAAKGLEPVGEADRRTLMRRLSFDLTGLPPSPAEVDAFLEDSSPGAYEKLVERLLASPHYGERMAVQWLDLVRYADSVGYHSDVPVNVYLFRDYVIRAFNENKPFDDFTREQLAGDLLPGASEWQKVASAYNRIGRMTNEGGAQAREYLIRYAADRVRTTSTAWLGSTLGCAECHDHKFDPFAQKDFYQMAAFFADIEEQGVYGGRGNWGSSIRVLRAEARKEIAGIDGRLNELRQRDGKVKPSDKRLAAFRDDLLRDQQAWHPLSPEKVWNDCSDPDFNNCDSLELGLDGGGAILATIVEGKKKPNKAVYKLESPLDTDARIASLRIDFFPAGEFERFELSELRIETVRPGERPRRVAIEAFVPDWEDGEGGLLRTVADGNTHTGWGGDMSETGPRQAVFVFERALAPQPGDRLRISLVSEGRPSRGVPGLVRVAVSASDFPEAPLPAVLREALREGGELEPAAQESLAEVFAERTAGNPRWREVQRLERRRQALLDAADECLVTRAVEPREVRVLGRGDWMDESGEIAEPQAPHFLTQIPANGRRLTRLDLADWLVSRENPLTARVFVNRLWKMFFGTGLAKTLDDLGSQGEAPLHEELLDWLAVEFMESGWDVKHIVRTMVLSSAYRLSSEAPPKLREKDPYNRYHARQTPFRVEAEFVRDAALTVSGLLDREVGGPSVKPYQPAGYYRELNFPKREYEPNFDERQFRRGLYAHWQRTFLHPSLMAFDAPAREECVALREVSNTPLQALALLNDPSYVEAARAFAVRILEADAPTLGQRLNFAFREAFSRQPGEEEIAVLEGLYRSQLARYEQDRESAGKILSIGIAAVPENAAPAELAAWTNVARALINKHEFITRY